MQHRIGIFGGSFNPFHLGHLNIANVALKQIKLDKVLFIPCKVSPFKTGCCPDKFVDDFHRLKMTELGIEGYGKFELSRIEIDRGGISYSHDTVLQIRKISRIRCFFSL
jgi:nicotinate-nucleotide adenylyltransferase